MGVVDAKSINEPITFSAEDIQPRALEMSQRNNSRVAARLRAIAEQNTKGRQQAVSALVRMTGNARAIRVNNERNQGGN